MPGQPKRFEILYSDISDCTGLSLNATFQHVTRAKFDPHSLKSIVLYLARHAKDGFRQEILESALRRDQETSIGKDPRAAKKKPTKKAKA